MSNTALGAGNLKKIIFADLAHKRFYFEQLKFVRCQDVYHEALIYCLGICGDTRRNIVNVKSSAPCYENAAYLRRLL